MKRPTLLIAIAVAAMSFGGCLPTHNEEFDIVARNIGNVTLDKVRIEFEGFYDSNGVLPVGKGGDSTFSGHVGPFPKQAKLTWQLPGPAYMPEISVVIPVPHDRPVLERGKAQRYELRFELDGNTATAKYIINDYTWMRELERTEKWPEVKQN